jgi:hypothetical protein
MESKGPAECGKEVKRKDETGTYVRMFYITNREDDSR